MELLISTVHRIGARAEKKVTEQLINAFKKVSGKENILFKFAEASLGAPEGTVRQVVFPPVSGGEATLRELVQVDRLAVRLPTSYRPIRAKGLPLPRLPRPGRRPHLLQELDWGVAGVTRKTRDAIAVCDAVAPVTRGVFLTEAEGRLDVVVSPPAARSPAYGPRRLFALEPGQRGCWRFNGHFTPDGCSCHSHHWWYEKWVVNIAYVSGTPPTNLFTQCEPTHAVDNRVRLF
ncbi:hypothetical protein IQ62_20530 [Streptomyces scabiei]|nr:hypothetical protein IQ62_20530 [Streptomyces scabiei]